MILNSNIPNHCKSKLHGGDISIEIENDLRSYHSHMMYDICYLSNYQSVLFLMCVNNMAIS